MTLGQVLLSFDGMIDYVEMTNPWGSGDDKDAKPAGSRNGGSTLTSAQAADPGFIGKYGGVAMNRRPEHLPDDARAALGLNRLN